jgi:ribosome-binding protein aMBF1 (putative translation factor)
MQASVRERLREGRDVPTARLILKADNQLLPERAFELEVRNSIAGIYRYCYSCRMATRRDADVGDFFDETIASRTAADPTFPPLLAAAASRRELVRELVALRALQGLSQTAVAARMGTSQPVVARLEAGDLDSRISTLERYAQAVGVELEMRLTQSRASSL